MHKAVFEFFRTRWDHFKQCWEYAQHHSAVSVIAACAVAYSVWTEYVEPWVEVPQMHFKKLPISWALVIALAALFFIVLEGSYRRLKAISVNIPADVMPELILEYSPIVPDSIHYSGFFLRTENEREAFKVHVSSPDTVGKNRTKIGMQWLVPGGSVGKNRVVVKLKCVHYIEDIAHGYGGIQGRQISLFFENMAKTPLELIATLTYADSKGNDCGPKKFKISQADILDDKKVSCEPIGSQAAS